MNRKVRVLSIDGGGIRGIIPAKILIYVEALLKEYSKNPNARIGDYFDLIAGTSTGGILTALCLCPEAPGSLKPKYSAQEMLDLYVRHGKMIFQRSLRTSSYDYLGLFNPLYKREQLERILKDYLGDYRLSDLTRPCLIPAYDIEQGKAVFFNKLSVNQNTMRDFFIRDVVRASTAAPTYFPIAKPSEMKDDEATFIDGGLFANNPALCAYIEATKFPCEPLQRDILVLSLGTGSKAVHYPSRQAKNWGRLSWVIPVIDIYGSAASQTVDHQLRRLYEQKDLAENYLRIEPNLDEFDVSKRMDNASDKNIQALQHVGDEITKKNELVLRDFIKRIYESNKECSHQRLYSTKEI